jgi:hypothetical protein
MPLTVPQIIRSQQRKVRRHQPDPNHKVQLLCNTSTGSLLTYLAIRKRLNEMKIGVRDIGERDIGETVANSRSSEALLLHIDI